MPPEDFAKLVDAAGRDKPLCEFAAYTGLRLEELAQLEWPDVRDGFVTVRKGKGRRQRLVHTVTAWVRSCTSSFAKMCRRCVLNRRFADERGRGDLLVGPPPGHVGEDPDLAR